MIGNYWSIKKREFIGILYFQEDDDFHLQYEEKESLKKEREQLHNLHREEEDGEEEVREQLHSLQREEERMERR